MVLFKNQFEMQEMKFEQLQSACLSLKPTSNNNTQSLGNFVDTSNIQKLIDKSISNVPNDDKVKSLVRHCIQDLKY